MLNKSLIILFIAIGLLIGCQNNRGLPLKAEEKMEKVIGMDITVPIFEGYEIKYANIEYPPILNNRSVGNRHVANIVYTNKRGNLIELSKKQKEMIEKENRQEILYGEYEGKSIITLNISYDKSSLAYSKTSEIEGISVEYDFKGLDNGETVGFFVFNVPEGSYGLTIYLEKEMTKDDAFALVKNTIEKIK